MATKRKAYERWLHVRVSDETFERYREVVEAEHRNVSQDIRRYIDQRAAEAPVLREVA